MAHVTPTSSSPIGGATGQMSEAAASSSSAPPPFHGAPNSLRSMPASPRSSGAGSAAASGDPRVELAFCRSLLRRHGLGRAVSAMDAEMHSRVVQQHMLEGEADVEDMKQSFDFPMSPCDNPSPDYEVYRRLYTSCLQWTRNALEEHKSAFFELLFVIFFEMWLRLFRKVPDKASLFIREFAHDHEARRGFLLDQIRSLTHPKQLKGVRIAKHLASGGVMHLRMRRLAYKLLMTHLMSSRSAVLMDIVQSKLSIEVVPASDLNQKELGFAFPAEQHQAALSLNDMPIYWGLPDEEVAADDLRDMGFAMAGKFPRTPIGFPKRYDGEPTEVVGPHVLPPILPEPNTWTFDVWKERRLQHYKNQAEVNSSLLPSILAYTWNTTSEVTCISVSEVDGSLAACAADDNSICVVSLASSELARAAAHGKDKGIRDQTDRGRGYSDKETLQDDDVEMEESRGHFLRPLDVPKSGSGNWSAGAEHLPDPDTGDADGGAMGRHSIAPPPPVAILRGHDGSTYGMSFSYNDRLLLSGGVDKSIRLWNIAAESCLAAYESHQAVVWDLQFAPFGHFFASASGDCTARLWALDRSYPIRIFAQHTAEVNVVKFHPNGANVASGSADGSVRLADVRSGKSCRVFLGHAASVMGVAVSHNGRLIASGDNDGTIIIWDIAAGRRVETLRGHQGRTSGLAFSHGSQMLATGSIDMSVKLWDVTGVSRGEAQIYGSKGHSVRQRLSMAGGGGRAYGGSSHVSDFQPCGPTPGRANGHFGVGEMAGMYGSPLGLPRSGQRMGEPLVPGPPPRSEMNTEPIGEDGLIHSYSMKDTQIHHVTFTPRNLLISCGVCRVT